MKTKKFFTDIQNFWDQKTRGFFAESDNFYLLGILLIPEHYQESLILEIIKNLGDL